MQAVCPLAVSLPSSHSSAELFCLELQAKMGGDSELTQACFLKGDVEMEALHWPCLR